MGGKSQTSPSRLNKLRAKAASFKNPYSKESEAVRKELRKLEAENAKLEANKKRIQTDSNFRDKLLKRCDFGTMPCRKCLNPQPTFKKGHHPTCHENPYAKRNYKPPTKKLIQVILAWDKGLQFLQSMESKYKRNIINLGLLKKEDLFEPQECPNTNYFYNALPTLQPAVAAEAIPAQSTNPRAALEEKLEPWMYKEMTASLLKRVIPIITVSWTAADKEAFKKAKVSLPVLALVQYIRIQFPSLLKHNNGLKHGGNPMAVAWLNKHFERGVISFTAPKSGRKQYESLPNPMYESLQDTTIYITKWDVVAPDVIIKCRCGGIFKSLRQPATPQRIASNLKPIFNLTGRCAWEYGCSYQCNSCEDIYRSSSPQILTRLPEYLSGQLPVDPKYCTNAYFLLDRSTTTLLDEASLTAKRDPPNARRHDRL